MAQINKKQIITAGLVGGTIFSIVVTLFDYFFREGVSWSRVVFYFVFGCLMYGFLTYRNFKKHNKKQ